MRRGYFENVTAAAAAINGGTVLVTGIPASKSASQVTAETSITLASTPSRFVSRGGEKLAGALEFFGTPVEGRRCVDIGSSTGGFTDCLLQRGAALVVAIDVGHGQLHWSLRGDMRVDVLERSNFRNLDPESIGGPADLVVVDVSFISLKTISINLALFTATDGDLVVLVKPQFEAGKARVPAGGVIRDPRVHQDVLSEVVGALEAAGLPTIGVTPSTLRGADGNVEFFLACTRSGEPMDPYELKTAVAQAHDVTPAHRAGSGEDFQRNSDLETQ